jgi:aminoglycoside phosphotransferase family enzyme/predicted kinase
MSEDADNQQEVFGFLADPDTHGGEKVQRIDTHAASVFLAGDRALKVKRAVRFPFLDYSTLEKRKEACEAEIAVNVPYAPEIYRGVAAITREASAKLAIGGAGTPVEWAVDMRRFDEKRTLDHITGEIDDTLADALGRAVAAAHAGTCLVKAPAVEAGRWIAAIGTYIDEHVEAFGQHPDIFPAAARDELARRSRTIYQRIVPLLRERGRQGFIRRIHGDLHLGNIVLIDGRPVPFDAIEFSDIIGSGDVFYDLAFLLMDLLERGLAPAANIVLNRYLTQARRIENLDALATLPFFLSMRAAIRAKVTAARLERAADADRPPIARAARAYFDFATRAIAPPGPALIAVGGLSGTGKSVLGRMLAPAVGPMPGAVIVRSDVERKALFGLSEAERLPSSAYTDEVNDRVYDTLGDKARRIVAASHSVIVDAVFAKPQERAAIAEAAKSARLPLQGLFLTADTATRLSRVGGRIRDASDADAAVALAQDRYELGHLEWATIEASGTPEATLTRAKAELAAASSSV